MEDKSGVRPGALLLGGTFALGTCYVLLADVRAPRDFTVDHAVTLLVLLGTVAAGHMLGREARALRLLRAGGLAALLAAGTMYCVTSSAARNAESSERRSAPVAAANDARRRALADLDEAKLELRQQRSAQAQECATGDGARCRGRAKTAEAAAQAVAAAEQRLSTLSPERPTSGGLAHAATVFASMPLVTADAATVEAWLVLMLPFAKAVFLELATIVFLGIGLGRGRRPRETVSQHCGTVSDQTKEEGRGVWTREQALRDLLALTEKGAVSDQQFLARRWGQSKSTVSRWMSSWERRGLVSRSRDGKRKRPVTVAASSSRMTLR